MKFSTVSTLLAAIFPLVVFSAPFRNGQHDLNKRSLIMVYETCVTTVTIDVTVTVYPGQPTDAAHALYDDPRTSFVTSTSTTSTSSSSTSTSSVVTPTPSSTSTSTSTSVSTPPPPPPSTTPPPPPPVVLATPTPSVPVSAFSVAPAVASTSAAATPVAASSGGSGGQHFTNGDMTHYTVGLGSCGFTNTASEHVIAVSQKLFDPLSPIDPYSGLPNPNKNPLCGKTVNITFKGQSYSAKIVDSCSACKVNDIDMSDDFFNLVTNHGDGRVPGCAWDIL